MAEAKPNSGAGALAAAKLLLERDVRHYRASHPDWNGLTPDRQLAYLKEAETLILAYLGAAEAAAAWERE